VFVACEMVYVAPVTISNFNFKSLFLCLKLESTIELFTWKAKRKNVAARDFFLLLPKCLIIHKNFNSSVVYAGLETGTSAQRRYSLLHCSLRLWGVIRINHIIAWFHKTWSCGIMWQAREGLEKFMLSCKDIYWGASS